MEQKPVQTKEEAITALQNLFANRADVVLLVLHGSAAADHLRDDSDIDVAIALDHQLTAEEKLDLMYEISQATARESDVAETVL